MADLGMNFNASEHKPLDSYDPIPADTYEAMIVESDRVPTKDGGGELLNLTWQIIAGEYEGRKVFDRVNLKNANPHAVEIGLRQLTSICHAVGVHGVQDSAELHEKPCGIKVKVRPAGPDKKGVHREAQNEIKGYEALEGAVAAPAVARQAPVTATRVAPTTTAPARKPWERGK